jgi:hypothetical protein
VRLDVAVQHARAMCGPEGGEHRQPDPGGAPRRQWTVFLDHLMQGPRRHVLHDDPRPRLGVHDVVDLHDVGMVELGRSPGLAERAVAQFVALGLGQPVRRDDLLDRHVTVQHLIAGEPDPAHPAAADRLQQAVPAGNPHRPQTASPSSAPRSR